MKSNLRLLWTFALVVNFVGIAVWAHAQAEREPAKERTELKWLAVGKYVHYSNSRGTHIRLEVLEGELEKRALAGGKSGVDQSVYEVSDIDDDYVVLKALRTTNPPNTFTDTIVSERVVPLTSITELVKHKLVK